MSGSCEVVEREREREEGLEDTFQKYIYRGRREEEGKREKRK